MIFHDTTLRELARARPRRLADLHGIPGVGEKKVEAFGAAVLDVILGDARPGPRVRRLRAVSAGRRARPFRNCEKPCMSRRNEAALPGAPGPRDHS